MAVTKHEDEPTRAFDDWVGAHHPAKRAEYAGGFWNYVELVREWAWKFGAREVTVVGVNRVRTPPPEEIMRLPITQLVFPSATVVLRHDFAGWPAQWSAGLWLKRPLAHGVPGFFDPRLAAAKESKIPGLALPPRTRSPRAFSCRLCDAWDVATLLRMASGARWQPRFADGSSVRMLIKSQRVFNDDKPVGPSPSATPARRRRPREVFPTPAPQAGLCHGHPRSAGRGAARPRRRPQPRPWKTSRCVRSAAEEASGQRAGSVSAVLFEVHQLKPFQQLALVLVQRPRQP